MFDIEGGIYRFQEGAKLMFLNSEQIETAVQASKKTNILLQFSPNSEDFPSYVCRGFAIAV